MIRTVFISLILCCAGNDLIAQTPWLEKFREPVFRMPLYTGPVFQLDIREGQRQFFTEHITDTYGVNGEFLGPVLEFQRGDFVQLYVTNHIGEATTMHWHGLHVPAVMDGGPIGIIQDGATWLAEFEVKDQAATYWYHPHPHRMTDEQVTNGISGMIIVRDGEESALPLPRDYNVDDIPLLIQSKAFNINTGQIMPTGSETHFMVNGTIYPYLELPRQVVRLRLLNGSNLRVLYLGFSDNRTFYQVASDGGLLPEPIPLTRVSLATGERAEILVDLSDLEDLIYLVNYSREQEPGTPGTPFTNAPNLLDARNLRIMEFRGSEPTPDAVTQIPDELRAPYTVWDESEADVIRHYTFQINWLEFFTSGFLNGFTIDNQPYAHHIINHVSYLDDIEIWEIYNNTPFAHPFHIHDEQFYVLDRDGMPPPPNERGRKDVVLVNGGETVRIIMQFTDYADSEIPYMYHCHILSHEDAGMMGQFLVVSRVTGIEDNMVLQDALEVYPNPAGEQLTIDIGADQGGMIPLRAEFRASDGKLVHTARLEAMSGTFDIGMLAPGSYLIVLTKGEDIVGAVPFLKP